MYDRKPLISEETTCRYTIVSVTGIKYEVISHLDLCDWYADWKKRGSPHEEVLEVYDTGEGQVGEDSSSTIIFSMDPFDISAIIADEKAEDKGQARGRLLV